MDYQGEYCRLLDKYEKEIWAASRVVIKVEEERDRHKRNFDIVSDRLNELGDEKRKRIAELEKELASREELLKGKAQANDGLRDQIIKISKQLAEARLCEGNHRDVVRMLNDRQQRVKKLEAENKRLCHLNDIDVKEVEEIEKEMDLDEFLGLKNPKEER